VALRDVGFVAGVAQEGTRTRRFKRFLSRYFYLCMSLLLAVIVVSGFSRTVGANLFHASPPRPWLLWMHGAVFSTWIVFFIAQSALVRVRRVAVHRLLGWFGVGLATVMVVLGLTVAVVMGRFDVSVLHQKDIDQFLAIPIVDMLIFGACVGLAVYWRKKPEFHRRLLFLGSCELLNAAFGRFDFLSNNSLFFVALDCVILLGLGRDWLVDGRVHKVYRYWLPAMIAVQVFAIYLWRANPAWWAGITHAILGV
jgi:hypothetical protein